jgi:hypothetical protein
VPRQQGERIDGPARQLNTAMQAAHGKVFAVNTVLCPAVLALLASATISGIFAVVMMFSSIVKGAATVGVAVVPSDTAAATISSPVAMIAAVVPLSYVLSLPVLPFATWSVLLLVGRPLYSKIARSRSLAPPVGLRVTVVAPAATLWAMKMATRGFVFSLWATRA